MGRFATFPTGRVKVYSIFKEKWYVYSAFDYDLPYSAKKN
jgi:hypothetical protein